MLPCSDCSCPSREQSSKAALGVRVDVSIMHDSLTFVYNPDSVVSIFLGHIEQYAFLGFRTVHEIEALLAGLWAWSFARYLS